MTQYRIGRTAISHGSIPECPIPMLLHNLFVARACGVLKLKAGGKQKAIEFGDGYPLAIWSNLSSERLDARLAAAGRLERRALDEANRQLARNGQLLGEILVALDYLSESDVAVALREQADEKLLEIFSWPRGKFRFFPGQQLRRSTRIAVVTPPGQLIARGVAERMSIETIDTFWKERLQGVLLLNPEPYEQFDQVDIGPGEAAWLESLGAGAPVSSVAQLDESQRRSAYAFFHCGLLSVTEPEAYQPDHELEAEPGPTPAQQRALAEASRRASQRLEALARELRATSPFERLGLEAKASVSEIEARWRDLACETHPDRFVKFPEAVSALARKVFQGLQSTYEVLSDPEQLKRYRKDPLHDLHQEEAADEVQRALKAERVFQTGVHMLNQHRWKPAFDAFREAVQLYPDEGEYQSHFGWTYYLVHGQSEEALRKALKHTKRGAKLAPRNANTWLLLGRVYAAMERFSQAEQSLLRALQCDPKCTDAMRELRILQERRRSGPVRSLLNRLRSA